MAMNNNVKMTTRRQRVFNGLDAFSFVIFGCSTVLIMCLIGFPCHVHAASNNPESVGICSMVGCNCTTIAHHWINVKCIFSKYQVNFKNSSLLITLKKFCDLFHCSL